jgi:hypothetical protein
LECHGAMSRECSLDAVAARNVLKVALAANVAASDECTLVEFYNRHEHDHDDPYADMLDMHDECLNSKMTMHRIPTETVSEDSISSSVSTTTTTTQQKLDHIVQCAENGQQCSVEEMMSMIEELERLNMECGETHHVGASRECILDAVEARNILKVALASQVEGQVLAKNAKQKQQQRRL